MAETPEIVDSPRERLCYKHPDRRGGVTCQRCDRPICPECMFQASVGFHCPECTSRYRPKLPIAPRRSTSGSRQSTGPAMVTRVLLALNGLVFVYSVAMTGSLEGVTRISRELLVDGGLFARAGELQSDGWHYIGVDAGEYYRIITSAFLHDGMLHLAFNMYALWLLGELLEAAFGRARFLSLYLVSMFGGAFGVLLLSADAVRSAVDSASGGVLSSWLTAPNQATVGASGAVYGLMGAMLLVQRAIGSKPLRSRLGALLFLNLALTLAIPGISIGGHFGGLAAGLVMGSMMLAFERRGAPVWRTLVFACSFSVALVSGSLLAAGI